MHGLALCAGVGGLELGLQLVLPKYRTVCYVEREAYAAATLVARMAEGALDAAPVWDDLYTFDGRCWRGNVSIISAGFPCQPWSAAGSGAGFDDERWLWPEPGLVRIIREVEPEFVWLENVAPLVSRGGLAAVLGDLADLGFDAEWDCLRAADVGASHRRERIFILAYRRGAGCGISRAAHDDDGCDAWGHVSDGRDPAVADTDSARLEGRDREHRSLREDGRRRRRIREAGDGVADTDRRAVRLESERDQRDRRRERAAQCEHAEPRADVPLFPPAPSDLDAWQRLLAVRPDLAPAVHGEAQSAVRGVVDGASSRVDRLRACGNAVVPLQAAYAFCALAARAGLWR